MSGSADAADRPELGPEIASMGRGNVLVVAKLDRLSRSVQDFAGLLARAEREGWAVAALDIGIDTTTPTGALIAHMVVAIGEWEARMIGLRTREGLAEDDQAARPPEGPAEDRRPDAVASPAAGRCGREGRARQRPEPARHRRPPQRLRAASLRGGRWHRESVRRLIPRLAT